MNSTRLYDTDTPAALRSGPACALLSSAYRLIEEKAFGFLLGNEDEAAVT
ncbi:MAG: hypothetical protein ABW098_17800 [Candidatus Thiodiazotropha sp.]